MPGKIKKTILILFLILIVALSIFAYSFSSFLALLFFSLGPAILAVFLWGIKGIILSVVLIILTIGTSYDAYDFSSNNAVFGTAAYLIIIAVVSKLRNVAGQLKRSEEQYREVVEKASDGIVVVQDGLVKFANSKIGEILGYDIEGAVGTDFKKYLAEEEVGKVSNFYQKKKKGEEAPAVYETKLKTKKGNTIYVELNVGTINYQERKAELIIVRDIGQRKQIEEIIYQKEQEFRILVEKAPDVIARFDNEFRCIYINSTAKEEFGISPKQFFWKNLWEAGISEKTVLVWEKALADVFKNGKEKTIYLEQETPRGPKYYQTRVLPEYNKEGKIRTVLSISRDITEAEKIDRVKSEFISISSHQLRTPLSIIRWCSSLLLDESIGKINEEQRGHLNRIYSAGKKMIKLTNAFLNIAILDLGILNVGPTLVNLAEIAEDVLKDFEFEIEEREIEVIKKYRDDMPLVKADKRLLRIVFSGLISNAIKYGHQKGKILIEIKIEKSSVLVKIADDGYGISRKEQDKIFSKFFRAENIKEKEIYGTGLDLYIIKSIIENCEGEIWFESPNPELGDLEKGTIFYFILPIEGISKRRRNVLDI